MFIVDFLLAAQLVGRPSSALCGVTINNRVEVIRLAVERFYGRQIVCVDASPSIPGADSTLINGTPTERIDPTAKGEKRTVLVCHELLHFQLWIEGIFPFGSSSDIQLSSKYSHNRDYVSSVSTSLIDTINHEVIRRRMVRLGYSEKQEREIDMRDTMHRMQTDFESFKKHGKTAKVPMSAFALFVLGPLRELGPSASPMLSMYKKYHLDGAIELARKLDVILARGEIASAASAQLELQKLMVAVFDSPERYDVPVLLKLE